MNDGVSTRESALIPTADRMKSYGCLRSLNRRGIRTIVASEYDRIPHYSSRYCSERRRVPSPTDDLLAYRDALLEIASRPDVETIVPVREFDVYLFAKYRELFERQLSLLVPDIDVLENAHDRLRLAERAEQAGVPVAETRLLSEAGDWNAHRVVKSRYNLLADHYLDSYSPRDAEQVRDIRFLGPDDSPDTAAIRDGMNHDPIVQEYVFEAKKHLYCALWEDGEPRATYQHRQIRKNSWVGGGGVYRESVHSPAVDDVAYRLLHHLDWDGFACIEYVKDANTGEWKFLEINPRIWQSLTEAVRAGVDFPYYYWLCTQGSSRRFDAEYADGVACHIAYGEVAHLLSVLRDDSPFVDGPSFLGTMWDIARSCITDPRFDYIRQDDPGLFLSAIRHTLSSGVTRSRQYAAGDDDTAGGEHDFEDENSRVTSRSAVRKQD